MHRAPKVREQTSPPTTGSLSQIPISGGLPPNPSTTQGKPHIALTAIRLVCAITLIGVSLWALLLPPLFPYSAHAVVNTKVVTVKAKEPGRIESLPAARLAVVKNGDEIVRIARDEETLQRRRQDAEFTRQKIQVRLDSLDAAIKVEMTRLAAAKAEQEKSREGLGRLQVQARENTTDKVRLRKEELDEKRAAEARVAPLFKEGIVTAAQWSRTRGETLDAERSLREAESELAVLSEGLSSNADPARDAIEGLATRTLGLEREISGLNLQRIDLTSQISELDARIAATSSRLSEGTAYPLVTPINGIIWRQFVVPGETLVEGQPIVEIADGASLFVEAYFRRDFLNSITVGDRANIYLIGGGKYVGGHVAEVQVQERANREPDIINTAPLDPSMLRIRIELDPGEAANVQLGSLAKVLITSGRAGVFERTMLGLSLLLRSHQ
jgi:multidrug resistance efflux pump